MAAGEPLTASPASTTRATVDESWPFRAIPAEVPDARQHVRKLAEQVFGYGERSEDVRLAASEVLTNAVVHGEGQTVHVRVATTDTAFRVEVRNNGRTDSPHIPDAPIGDHGRGLVIVKGFTNRWGSQREAGGLCVWFEVDFEKVQP